MGRGRFQQAGYLYQEGNWWRLRWREDVIPADGTPVRTRPSAIIGPCRGPRALTKAEARRVAWDTILSRVDAFTRVPQSIMTLGQFVAQKFRPEHVATLKHSGQLHYDYCLKKILPDLGDMPLRDITVNVLASFLGGLRGRHSSQTVAHLKTALSAILEHARRMGYFTGENPARLVRTEAITHAERQALSFEQARKVLDRLPSPVKEMAYLSMITSLNVAELCGLRWKRVNLTPDIAAAGPDMLPPYSLAVRENYCRNRYGTVKTGRRRRIVPLAAGAVAMLLEVRDRTAFAGPEDPVFTSKSGMPPDAHNAASRVLRPLGTQLGLPLSWHVFRHCCATFAEAIGMLRSDRIALMGHSGGEMTDRYTHSDIERRRVGVERISERILAALVQPEGEATVAPDAAEASPAADQAWDDVLCCY